MQRILSDIVAIVICLAVADTGFHARPCHKDRKAAQMVIPSIIYFSQGSLTVNRPSELSAPNDQSIP